MLALIIDTETTGIDSPDLVEYGEMEVHFVDGEIFGGNVKSSFFKPCKPIEYGAMATHGITNEFVANCPPSSSFEFGHKADFIIGHNIDYDWKVIVSPPCRRICTLALARSIWPDTSHKLLALAYMLFPEKAVKWHKSAHGVATDITMTHALVLHIAEHLGIDNFEDLWAASEKARVPVNMPFGKHAKTPIANLPIDYVQWALRSLTDLDPYLKKALEKRIEK